MTHLLHSLHPTEHVQLSTKKLSGILKGKTQFGETEQASETVRNAGMLELTNQEFFKNYDLIC